MNINILVIAEHSGGGVRSVTLSAVAAAGLLGPVTLVLVGHRLGDAAAAAARITGVHRVVCCDDPLLTEQMPDSIAPVVADLVRDRGFSHVIAAASASGKSLMPRIAALLDVMQLSDVIAIRDHETFVRPVHAGSAIVTLRSTDAVKAITVRTSVFPPAPSRVDAAAIETLAIAPPPRLSRLVERRDTACDRPELSDARIIVSGGRGLGSAAKFALLEPAARKLGAAIGASRAAVDAGYAASECQVGQTGKVVAPDLYLAFGISGAVQHLAGMKDSKVIVAVNTDPDAPIFQVADYGLVADLFQVLAELEHRL